MIWRNYIYSCTDYLILFIENQIGQIIWFRLIESVSPATYNFMVNSEELIGTTDFIKL
jgi:hypothetical protein